MRKIHLLEVPCFSKRGMPAVNLVQKEGPLLSLILVIDDSATIRHIVTTCLEREGFEVMAFPDGVETLRWLASPPSRSPDLVILDIGLPKMDGYEVARRLTAKPSLQQTALVMLTRRDSTIDRIKGHLAGASHYLVKPFQVQALVQVVRDALGQGDTQSPPKRTHQEQKGDDEQRNPDAPSRDRDPRTPSVQRNNLCP